MPTLLYRIDHQQHGIGGFCAFPCCIDHCPVERRFGENAQRVSTRIIWTLSLQCNAQHPRTGGLRLRTGDGNFCHPTSAVASVDLHIGRADHSHEAAFDIGFAHPDAPMNFAAATVQLRPCCWRWLPLRLLCECARALYFFVVGAGTVHRHALRACPLILPASSDAFWDVCACPRACR
ncbi:MAG: hypothetical protein R3E18_13105 [Sphingomonadaceae bacterium]